MESNSFDFQDDFGLQFQKDFQGCLADVLYCEFQFGKYHQSPSKLPDYLIDFVAKYYN